MTKKRWTEEEDKLIIQSIQGNLDNIGEGFKLLSNKIDRTEKAIAHRWYRVLSNPQSPKYAGNACFLVIGNSSRLSNRKYRKIDHRSELPKHKETIWNKILKLLKLK